jgi:hypothetical protein
LVDGKKSVVWPKQPCSDQNITYVQHWEIAVRYLIIKMDYESNKTPLLFFSVKKKISILLGLYNAHNRVMSPVLDPEAQAWL